MRFETLTLETRNVSAITSFYTEIMGLAAKRCETEQTTFQIGATELTFKQFTGEVASNYHFAIEIPVNQIDEAGAWLANRVPILPYQGRTLVEHRAWNAKSYYFTDLGGNIVEFIARGQPFKTSRKKKFDVTSLLRISEMGLVVPNVMRFCQHLNLLLDIPYYQEASDQFAAMGNDEGLLVISATGRGWIPVNMPARPHAVLLRMKGYVNRRWIPSGLPYILESHT
jgi:catechol 2,3-dioxygenase-like lactoylglutathione lyase family enzyme